MFPEHMSKMFSIHCYKAIDVFRVKASHSKDKTTLYKTALHVMLEDVKIPFHTKVGQEIGNIALNVTL